MSVGFFKTSVFWGIRYGCGIESEESVQLSFEVKLRNDHLEVDVLIGSVFHLKNIGVPVRNLS